MTLPTAGALVDTGVLLDYLCGDSRARHAIERLGHRSISVTTWLQLMALCPADAQQPTRGFLRTFERLSASEAIADEALRLMQLKPGLSLGRAMTWATANVNQLAFLTADAEHVDASDSNVTLAYRCSSPGADPS